MANSVDPDETAHNEPSHQDLHCLQGPSHKDLNCLHRYLVCFYRAERVNI